MAAAFTALVLGTTVLLGELGGSHCVAPLVRHFGKKHSIQQLTKENFASTVGMNSTWFIKFYSPLCVHCIQFKPIWAKFVETQPEGGMVHYGEVDGTVEKYLVKYFEVPGYPRMIFIHDRKAYTFKGKLTEDAMQEFVDGGWKNVSPKELMNDPIIFGNAVTTGPENVHDVNGDNNQLRLDLAEQEAELSLQQSLEASNKAAINEVHLGSSFSKYISDDSFGAIIESKPVWMVKFFIPWNQECHKMKQDWEEFAEKSHRELDFVGVGEVDVTKSRALKHRFQVTSFPTILLFQEGKVYTFDGPMKAASFDSFLKLGWKKAPHIEQEILPFYSESNRHFEIFRHYFWIFCVCCLIVLAVRQWHSSNQKGKQF